MPRKKTQQPPQKTDRIAEAGIDHEAIVSASADAAALGKRIEAVENTYGVDIPYQLDVFVGAIRQRAIESAQRLIEIGKLLIVMREHESREVFASAVERCGLTDRFARRAMQAALKLQDRSALQNLGVSKALELVSEDDDTLDDLASGGSVAGLKLDDIERMSVRELKSALRKERNERAEDAEANEEIVRKKDERINKLARRSTRSASREQVATLLEDLDRAAVEAATFIKQLRDTAGAINAIYDEAGEQIDEEVQQRLEANLTLASEWAHQLATDLGE